MVRKRIHPRLRAALVLPSIVLSLTFAADAQNPFQGRIDRWVMQDSLNSPPDDAILFVGSSSIRLWESLTRDLSAYDVIQRGFGGAQFSDLNLFVNDIVLPYDPAAIVVFLGGLDIFFGKSPRVVFDDYVRLFIDLVHTGQDQTRPPIPIFFIGITPFPAIWPSWNLYSEFNSLIDAHSRADENLHYIDTPTIFLATSPAPGQPPSADLFAADGNHESPEGYAIWNDAVTAALEGAVLPVKRFVPNPLHPPAGARILFDFGPSNPEDGDPTASPDQNGNRWNNWSPVSASRDTDGMSSPSGTSIMAGESVGNLITVEGRGTGIDLIVTGEFGTAGKRDGGLLAPDTELLGDLAVATATEDYFWGGASGFLGGLQTGGFMLTGLDPSQTYDLRFFGTRTSNSSWTTDYRIFGAGEPVTVSLQTSGRDIGSDGVYDGNDHEITVAQGIRSDEFGQVFVDVGGVGSHQTYLGLMEITVLFQFRRGDSNGDGQVDISDASYSLNWLFAGAATPGCMAALNTNGDEQVDIADAVALLNFLFADRPAPVAPFPDCGPGVLEVDKELGCEAPPPNCVAVP